jgi:hypothetical protein
MTACENILELNLANREINAIRQLYETKLKGDLTKEELLYYMDMLQAIKMEVSKMKQPVKWGYSAHKTNPDIF